MKFESKFHIIVCKMVVTAWWPHQMGTFSALQVICAGKSPATGEFPAQRPVTRSFVYFDLRPNKRLSSGDVSLSGDVSDMIMISHIFAFYTPNVFVYIRITVVIVMKWLMYKELFKPPAPIFRSLNLVMYFGWQLDEPNGFPGDHQPDATMLQCTYWYLPWISVIVLLLCSVGNITYYY